MPYHVRALVPGAVFAAACAAFSAGAWGAHPLITEDTGTQGRGKYQLELQFERAHDVEYDVTEKAARYATVLAYGAHEHLDVILTLPYDRVKTTVDDVTTVKHGRGDSRRRGGGRVVTCVRGFASVSAAACSASRCATTAVTSAIPIFRARSGATSS